MSKLKHPAQTLDDAEEARIQRQIADDPDDWEPTDEELAQAKPFREVFPEIAAKIEKAIRGRPPLEEPKQSISIRVDREVIAAFKAGGKGWQSRMNEALRRAAGL